MTKSILTAAFALVMGLTTSAFADEKVGDREKNNNATAITNPEVPGKVESKTSATAVFEFTGDEDDNVNDPNNYETEPSSVSCPGGTQRCSATFEVDENGNRIGLPQEPIGQRAGG